MNNTARRHEVVSLLHVDTEERLVGAMSVSDVVDLDIVIQHLRILGLQARWVKRNAGFDFGVKLVSHRLEHVGSYALR